MSQLLFKYGTHFLLAASLLWFFDTSPPKHRINAEGYERLRLGMTEKEVEIVLGVPAGDYGPGKGEILDYGMFTMASASIRTDPNAKKWLAGSFAITVCFDGEARVRGMGTDSVYRPYESNVEMVSQKLGISRKKPYPPGTLN